MRDRCGFRWKFEYGSRTGRPFRDGWNDLSRWNARFGSWRRVPRDGVLAGVCAGLARAVDVQPLMVRLGFVALGLTSGPFALIAYVVLAAALPVEEAAPYAETPPHRAETPPRREQAPPQDEAQERRDDFAQDARKAAAELAALRARLQDCDRRTAELERRVVADAFNLDRAIRDLGK